VHRDIKPENVLIDKELNNTLKIIDFGTSTIHESQVKGKWMSELHGTSYYIAPEVLKRKYNSLCDIWSVGVIMYILLCGKAPFDGEDDDAIKKRVIIGQYSMDSDVWKMVSSDAKELIKKLMNMDINSRYTAKQALGHSWFKNVTEAKVDNQLL